MAKLEIACFNLASAIIAQESGADRVELCDGFAVGGTTPNLEIIKEARAKLSIQLFVMIRPRGGDFVYTEEEYQQMIDSILQIKKLNVDGFVFGILHPDHTMDRNRNQELVQLASPIPCSFHRAFDVIDDSFSALENLIDIGFTTVLCSGHPKNVEAGKERLAELVKKAQDRITIMPGGGLRSSNIKDLQDCTKATYFHSSAIVSEGEIANSNEVIALKRKMK